MASVDNLVNLHEDDLLLIAQEENGQYVNKNVTIKQLIEELQLDYAVQKGTNIPKERHGIVMPGPTMDYDNATGELNVNFDTQSLRFLDYITNDGSPTGPNSIPAKPVGTETTGDFYIIGDRDVKLATALWGLGSYITEKKSSGGDYLTNNGDISVTNFVTNEVLHVSLVIENGSVTFANHLPSNTDDLTQFRSGQLLTPNFGANGSDGCTGTLPVLQVHTIDNNNGRVTFNIPEPGTDIHTGDLTGSLTGVRAIPTDPTLTDYGVVVDVELLGGQINRVLESYFVKGYEVDTELKVVGINENNGVIAEGGTVKVIKDPNVTTDDVISTFLNDRVVLTLDGWKVIDDTLARQAVHELKADPVHIEQIYDGSGALIDTINVVEFTDTSTPDEPKEVSLKIETASELNDGLFPKEFYNKLAEIPDAYGQANIIKEERILSPDNDGDDDNTFYYNTVIKEVKIQKLDANGNPMFEPDGITEIYEEGVLDYEIGINPTRENVQGVDEFDDPITDEIGRVHGTVFIPTQVELDGDYTDANNPIDPTDFELENTKYYSCVPNINTAEKRYLKVTGKKYSIVDDIKRVKIDGPTTTDKDVTSDVTFTATVEPVTTDLTYEWSLNDISVGTSDTFTISNDLINEGMNTVDCDVTYTPTSSTISERHYIYGQKTPVIVWNGVPDPNEDPLISFAPFANGNYEFEEGQTINISMSVTNNFTDVGYTLTSDDPDDVIVDQGDDVSAYKLITFSNNLGTHTLTQRAVKPRSPESAASGGTGASDTPLVETVEIEVVAAPYDGIVDPNGDPIGNVIMTKTDGTLPDTAVAGSNWSLTIENSGAHSTTGKYLTSSDEDDVIENEGSADGRFKNITFSNNVGTHTLTVRVVAPLEAAAGGVDGAPDNPVIKTYDVEVVNSNSFTTPDETGPKAINGYYPLYDLEQSAIDAGDGTIHSHEFDGVTYYMPNGVEFYHGDYGTDTTDSGDNGSSSGGGGY